MSAAVPAPAPAGMATAVEPRRPAGAPQQQQSPYVQHSYTNQRFAAEFYDRMVDDIFGGIASPDMEVVAALATAASAALLRASSSGAAGGTYSSHPAATSHTPPPPQLRVLDAGCGTARALLALLARARAVPRGAPLSRIALQLWGADASAAMIDVARRKLSEATAAATAAGGLAAAVTTSSSSPAALSPLRLPPPAVEELAVQTFQEMHMPSLLSAGGAHLAVVTAGGLHHVLTRDELKESLRRLKEHLAPGGTLAVSFMPWSHLCRDEGGAAASKEVFKVGPFERTLLSRTLSTGADGAQLVTERFRLAKLRPAAGTAAADVASLPNQPQQSTYSPGSPGSSPEALAAATTAPDCAGSPEEEWAEEEGWAMRRIDGEELEILAAAVGLFRVPRLSPDVVAAALGAADLASSHYLFFTAAGAAGGGPV